MEPAFGKEIQGVQLIIYAGWIAGSDAKLRLLRQRPGWGIKERVRRRGSRTRNCSFTDSKEGKKKDTDEPKSRKKSKGHGTCFGHSSKSREEPRPT